MGAKSMVLAEVLLSLVGLIVGGLIGFYYAWRMWKIQTRHQLRMLAKAFLLEVQRLKPMLNGFSNMYRSVKNGRAPFSNSEMPPIDHPLYDSQSLFYYAAQKEICFFSSDLAERLYAFYMALTGAELARQRAKETCIKELRVIYAETVWDLLLKANEIIPNLEQLLVKETGMSCGISKINETLRRKVRQTSKRIVALRSKRGDGK